MKRTVKVGVVGAGKFAGYHAQKIDVSKHAEFVGVFDVKPARADALSGRYHGRRYERLEALADACDAVIVACPASLHYAIAKALLQRGCHVLVEKPLALSGKHANALADLAVKTSRVLQVGHQERIVCKAFGLFTIDETPINIDITRLNPPPAKGRSLDVSVIWDLMIHDLDLVHLMVGERLEDAMCQAAPYLGTEFDEAIASFRIGKTDISLRASRIASKADRRMEIVFASGQLKIDFMNRKLENTTHHKLRADLDGFVLDPLLEADEMFFQACLGEGDILVSGRDAALAVSTAEKLSDLAMGYAGHAGG